MAITFCADYKQQLYGWNDADKDALKSTGWIANILSIEEFELPINYRSTGTIIHHTNLLGSHISAEDSDKVYLARPHENTPKGHPIVINGVDFFDEQVSFIVDQIEENNFNLNDIFVIARTNSQCSLVSEELTESGIPNIHANGGSFWDRKHVKIATSYLFLSEDPNDGEALEKCYNVASPYMQAPWGARQGSYTPTRFLGKQFLKEIGRKINPDGLNLVPKKWENGYRDLIDTLEGIKVAESIKDKINIISDLVVTARSAQDEEVDTTEIKDDIESIVTRVEKQGSIYAFKRWLQKLKMVGRDQKNNKKERVQIMTPHKAKGLENRIVFIVGACEAPPDYHYYYGSFPHTYATNKPLSTSPFVNRENEGDIDGERCAFYVAATRAMERLFILYYQSGGEDRPYVKSRFIEEMGL